MENTSAEWHVVFGTLALTQSLGVQPPIGGKGKLEQANNLEQPITNKM
jgi:hypothetical protein